MTVSAGRGDLAHGNPQSGRGVEDAGAIHVNLESALVRAVADFANGVASGRRCRRAILCVCSMATSPVGAEYGFTGWMRRRTASQERMPVIGLDGADHAAGKPGHHGELVVQHVRARIADHFLPVLGEELDRDGVPHGAGGDEQRGLFADDLGGALFQAVDGGVFAIDIVADFGLEHGAPHRRAWAW